MNSSKTCFCRYCGDKLPPALTPKVGRPANRMYCNKTCRSRYYETRREAKPVDLVEADAICLQCNKPFKYAQRARKYCTPRCRKAASYKTLTPEQRVRRTENCRQWRKKNPPPGKPGHKPAENVLNWWSPVHTTLPHDVRAAFNQVKDEHGLTAAELARRAITHYIITDRQDTPVYGPPVR